MTRIMTKRARDRNRVWLEGVVTEAPTIDELADGRTLGVLHLTTRDRERKGRVDVHRVVTWRSDLAAVMEGIEPGDSVRIAEAAIRARSWPPDAADNEAHLVAVIELGRAARLTIVDAAGGSGFTRGGKRMRGCRAASCPWRSGGSGRHRGARH
jgi:single-stranded DNA-binding protein